MPKEIRNEKTDYFFSGLLKLQSIDECYDFFEDLCTVEEIYEMSKRLYAAKMLSSGAVYTEVAEETGLSTATISRVNKCIKYGTDGYKTVIDRLDKE